MSRLRSSAALAAITLAPPLTACTLLLGYGDEVQLARAPDASLSGDARADSSADGVTRSFCETLSPRPTLCSSFDGPTLLSEWTGSSLRNARFDRDTTSFVSAPASLRIALERDAGASRVEGAVNADFLAWADKPFTAKIGFDIAIESASPTGALAVVATPIYLWSQAGVSYLVQLAGRPLGDGATLSLGVVEVTLGPDNSLEHSSSVPLQMGKWTHVDLTVALTGQNSARLALDGVAGYDGPLELAPRSGTPSANFGFAMVEDTANTWAMRLDNVTIDIH